MPTSASNLLLSARPYEALHGLSEHIRLPQERSRTVQRLAGAGPVDSRTMSSVETRSAAMDRPAIARKIAALAFRPISKVGTLTVVSGGVNNVATSISSNPVIDNSRGTFIFSSLASASAPAARRSVAHIIAVGLGVKVSARRNPALPASTVNGPKIIFFGGS